MMEDIVNIIEKNLFLVFGFCFFIFYVAYIKQDFTKLFFLGFITIIGFFILIENNKKKTKINGSVKQFIDKIEKDVKHFQINYDKVFQVHRAPKALKFIRKNTNVSQLLFEIRWMEVYNYGSFLTMIIYLEFFLKHHYGVMMGKLPYDHYIQIMKDLRSEILNISKTFIFSVPPRSTVLKHIANVDDHLFQWHNKLVAVTDRYIAILNNKFLKKKHHIVRHPYEYDAHDTSQHYEMY